LTTFDVSSIGFYVLDVLRPPVSEIPPGGRAAMIEAITLAGTGAATAAACGLLGLKTRAVTTLGADDLGDFMLAKLKRYGVDCTLVKRVVGVPTSSTILPVRPNGERPALHVRGSASTFQGWTRRWMRVSSTSAVRAC
jgi:sugar/nucleoside kinase (ribokinase family)